MSIAEKVVVITGASRGIGRSVAEHCAAAGAKVVLCARDAEKLGAVISAIEGAGGDACGVPADVTDYAAVEHLREAALERHGRVDVWFNNAGISLGYAPVDEESPEDLARIVGINLTGHLYGCRAILPYFREHGGYLMNMCGRGYKGQPTPHTAVYAATKTAIASITRSIAAENSAISNLSVNGFVPGMVETDFYVDLRVSPRLADTAGDWRVAMDAFGVPLDEVGRRAAEILGEAPGRTSGKIISLITPAHMATGIAKMAWWGMRRR